MPEGPVGKRENNLFERPLDQVPMVVLGLADDPVEDDVDDR